MELTEQYRQVRDRSEQICAPLEIEDYVVQPVADVSPPKWHLGHTTWFFEVFILLPHLKGYEVYDHDFHFIFNSYYETLGTRVIRTHRGNLSRPSVQQVYNYRDHVDNAMYRFLSGTVPHDVKQLVTLGLNHEQQHQELLLTDIKYILGHNPLFPAYTHEEEEEVSHPAFPTVWVDMPAGIYDIGFNGGGFCFDNEFNRHQVYLADYKISKHVVTNGEYLEFMNAGGYTMHRLWHADGWDWVNRNSIAAPMYWHFIDGQWMNYTFYGLRQVALHEPIGHISFYEAAAFAAWKGRRLPTEFEWEAASKLFHWGARWEWTGSAYLPYPGYRAAEGAVGEYNGKFMVNQMVLRGASVATPPGHSRHTYRNFFQPQLRWQFTGIRLAE